MHAPAAPLLPLYCLLACLLAPAGAQNNTSACDPELYDRLALYTPESNGSAQACQSTLHPGCAGMLLPRCETRFAPLDGAGSTLQNFVSSCNECRANWYLPLGPTRRVCSVNGGPGVPAGGGALYLEQRVCRPCTTATGTCTRPGTALEVCTSPGRREDARCVPCTNAPENAVYTGPSPGVLQLCPYECRPGFYPVDEGGAGECRSCETDPCPVGQYRANCGPVGAGGQGTRGQCTACTTGQAANPSPLVYDYTTRGSPSDQDNCAYACRAGHLQVASGECTPVFDFDFQACGLGFELSFGDQCLACGLPPPPNARYDLDDGISPQKGGLCGWACGPGLFRNASDLCQPHTPRNCTTGTYLATTGTRTRDSQCAPCNSFTPSMDALASYRPPPLVRGLQGKGSMCVWDCKVGYFKPDSPIPACVRCQDKPLNAIYAAQAPEEPPADYRTG